MKTSKRSSTRQSKEASFVDEFGVKPLPTIEQMAGWPTQKPLLTEMLQQGDQHPWNQLTVAAPPKVDNGLFQSIMGGRLEVLLDDAQRNPDRYSAQELELLEQLASGQAKLQELSSGDRRVLDQAAISFTAFKPPRAPAAAPKPPPKPKVPELLQQTQEELPDLEHGLDLPPYWWL